MKTYDNLIAGMHEAMSLLQKDGPAAATVRIQQALQGLMQEGPLSPGKPASAALPGLETAPLKRADNLAPVIGLVPDLLARLGIDAPMHGARFELPTATPQIDGEQEARPFAPGELVAGSFANHAGTRAYKLYVPTAYRGQSLPLVVMLHGCSQTPDDFAAGTRFNFLAEDAPCLVLYPAQAPSANGTRCWRWFNAVDQQRERGEPSLIAGMTQDIVEAYGVDPAQVYIAGLSAGGAMALVMAKTYPELYAAVGIHSGVPYAAASDLASAFAAMNGAGAPAAIECLKGKPIIVFHGDRDDTVHPINSDRIVAQAMPRGATRVHRGQVEGGYAYTRTLHEDPRGEVVVEQWTVHGAGHAWFGGSLRGSFTDARGPDASREMMRFFAARSNPAARWVGFAAGSDTGPRGQARRAQGKAGDESE